MDSATFLLIVIVLVGGILIAVGIYLIVVLHEARQSLKKVNKILGHVDSLLEILDEKIARPATSLAGVLGVAREIVDMVKDFREGRHPDGEQR